MNHQTNSFLLILEVLYGHLKDIIRFFGLGESDFLL